MLLWLALLTWLVPQRALADDMTNGKYYTLTNRTGYVTFEVLLTDLYAKNTWAKDGNIKAYSGSGRSGTNYELVRVYTKEMDDDDEEYYNVWATNKRSTANAWLTNARYGSREIGTGELETSVYKGKSADRTYAKIDYYYGPELAGKKWYFYYEYTHSSGKRYDMYIGAAELSSTMGLKDFDLSKYKCERSGPRQFTFTTPAMPDDVSKDLEDIRKHFGEYIVTMNYHLYNGSTQTKKDTLSCTVGKDGATYGAEYNIEIPASVGNFKTVDMKVEATERLDGSDGNYYWKHTAAYEEKDLFLTVPVPADIKMEFRQFENKIELMWDTYSDVTAGKYYTDAEPYVYRIETDEKGEAMSGASWNRRTKLSAIGNKTSLTYIDRDAQMNRYYRYMIVNVPKSWTDKSKFISVSDLTSPTDELLNQLGCCRSNIINTEPQMTIHNLAQDESQKEVVRLTWEYSRVPIKGQTVDFKIWRRKTGTTQWEDYDKVTADANPTAGTVTEFIDDNLPNSRVRFDYMVVLEIYDKPNQFRSNIVSAGLLASTTVTELKATQGTYDKGVRVSWKAHQVGTDKTTYQLFRHYVGTDDPYQQIYTTSDTRDSYTYEDNNVEAGYYYEYKVEAYAGDKSQWDDNTFQNCRTAVGFSKARGLVRGRITFGSGGTGNAVEGARVSLTPSDSINGNSIKSSSQRVDGASTGIAWRADSTELAKVFGPDKEFTVQMFVRPDTLLNAGAVIGEIPGEGRLVLGSMNDGDYNLAMQKVSYVPVGSVGVDSVRLDPPASSLPQTPLPVSTKTTDLSTLTGDYIAHNAETLTGTLSRNYKISIADGAVVFLKDVTINGADIKSYQWAGINCPGDATLVLEGNNTVKGFAEEYPGIHIAEGKTLTIKGSGSLNASSNGWGAGIGGGLRNSCGNIVIEGGTITANGGQNSAGIGGGCEALCGNILIKGGTITANGGEYGAGIGSGETGSCGSITITYVEKLTVNRGAYARSIGKGFGDSSTCGQVTIDGTVYPDGINVHAYTVSLIKYRYYGTATNTNVAIPSNKYSLLTVSRTGGNLQFQVDGGEAKTLTATKLKNLVPFSVGGADGITEAKAFKGNLTEVRVWNKTLTEAEKAACADRVLNGRENNLALYWPMDEGLDHFVFDASYANDLPNGRHATVGMNISSSTIVPADRQLSRYAVTSNTGEYIIRGIPFIGEGSTYTLTPTFGIHEFQPETRSGFIGKNNLTLDNYDFTDTSSFPVKGQVTYLGTNIPVDSVQFMIDGQMVQSKEGVYSDANGKFEISVPIGQHLIECVKNGHRFTSFPLDKTKKYDFRRAETVNFVDSTLVNVTGRVNGGFSDQDAPVGFGQSKNRIGKAEIKLSLGRESQCSFNYLVNDRGEGSFGTTDIAVASATADIKSTACRAGTKHGATTDNDNTHYIYIVTDSLTGEFSAMLPPLKYQVESIRMVGGKDYDDKPVFAENLPVIDATNANKDLMKFDSLTVKGVGTRKYMYSAKMIRQYRAEPDITVRQTNLPAGVFGERKVAYVNDQFATDSIEVLTISGTGHEYKYGRPIFVQNGEYGYNIDVAENYTNLDTKKTIKEYPRDAQVHIFNEASATTKVYGSKGAIGRDSVEIGMPYETVEIEINPDEYGHAEYEFVAGCPNLAGEHLLNMTVSVTVDGRTTMWQAPGNDPNSGNNALAMIVLGAVGSGTNFVTQGPDHVDMVLRRPPGSTSVAKLTNKEVHVNSHTRVITQGNTVGGGVFVSETPTFENLEGSIGPIALLKNTKWKVVATQKVTHDNRYSDNDIAENDTSYTVTEEMVTPKDMQYDPITNSYVPEAGDTYIGRSTNQLFSKGRILGIFKNDQGQYAIGERSGITVGETLRTYFVLPQSYILSTLIPNWQAIIRSRLEEGHINADHTKAENCPKVAGKVMYYTKYKPGDREFGTGNGDLSFWTKEQVQAAGGHPSYTMVNGTSDAQVEDEVQNAINQIKRWREVMAVNEEEKVNAFDNDELLIDNFSIASGTSVSRMEEMAYTTGRTLKKDSVYYTSLDINAGAMINEAGAYAIVSSTWQNGKQSSDGNTTTKTNSVSWTMSDADVRTALSVDVFKSDKWGPIFRTRGGQTANPYEDGSVTKFYNPGTKLNEATMRVEKPELHVVGATEITDVPTGGKALFTLQLSNQSESNNICTYVLEVKDGSNPNGAVLTVDGNILSNGKDGRLIKFNPGETIEKTLVVMQGSEGVTNYEDIQLVLRSEKDITTLSDPVKLRVHFVPASSPVDLAVDHTVLNYNDKILYGGVTATMSNLDRNGNRLKGLRLRFRRKGTDKWNDHKVWSNLEAYRQQGAEALPDGSTLKDKVVFEEDGIYELQAQTWGMYGTAEVTYESNIVEVNQDTHGPKILGMVSPEDGLLTWLNRNNMHLRFNKQLNNYAISQSDNIIIEGGMNNVVIDQRSPYPDVALQLNRDSVETEAMFDLSGSSFALDMWLYRQGDGKIVSLGTSDNQLSLSTHDGGLVSVCVGNDDNTTDGQKKLPENEWIYMAMNYKQSDAAGSKGKLTLLYATANQANAEYIFQDKEIDAPTCHGKLAVGGSGMQGMVARMSMWKSEKTADMLYLERNKLRAPYTPGLIGYWKMDEGHGTQLTDVARSRHIQMPAESWYINNENRAVHIDGEDGLPIDISTFQPAKTDNYAIEMWFRGDESNAQAGTLFAVKNGLTVGYDKGALKLSVKNQQQEEATVDETLSEKSYLDNNWHHLALNVRRGTSAIAYIDGNAVKVLPENIIPGLSGKYLTIGEAFNGDFDDVRLWSAALDGGLIKERMYERMESGYPGLEGYFPMEDIHRTSQANVVTDFSLNNFGQAESRVKIDSTRYETAVAGVYDFPQQALNAPRLKPGSSKMRLADTQYGITVSADELYFSFPNGTLPLMDGNDFVATVSNIKGEHANTSEPVSWKFHCDFAALAWNIGEETLSKPWNEPMEWQVYIANRTGTAQSYELSGLPTWMTVDKQIGTIGSDGGSVTFRMSTGVPVGRHTEYIYLTDQQGIVRTLKLNLTVTGNVPDWTVDPDLYESNMTLTGQIYIKDRICENTDTRIAAFDKLGLCRGVASPKYVATRDAYYVDMVIYGGAATELSNGTSDIEFKVYDASTGTVRPLVGITIPGKEHALTFKYTPDANYGSYDAPVVFDVAEALQQQVTLAKGWTWMSLYVDPLIPALQTVLPKDVSILKRFRNIKSKTAFATVNNQGEVVGELEELLPGQMYKMQLTTKTNYPLVGLVIDTKNTPQTMRPGYNWIGTVASQVMSVDEAFAELAPEVGDRVKNRTAFAEFSSKGYWEGTLESIVPGEGYIYHSKAADAKTFHYPSGTAATQRAPRLVVESARRASEVTHFKPCDPYLYPDNLNIIAVVKKDGQERDDAEIGAFIDGECRGAISHNNGYYFLTAMGSSEEDSQKKMELRVYVDGEEYVADDTLPFISDAYYGSLDDPYVLDLDGLTGITVVSGSAADDDSDWWTLQGFKIGRKPTQPGVYIHRGHTVTIKQAK